MISLDVKIDLDSIKGRIEANYKLEIQKGEFITLFGTSGAGKTTLLRIIAGLEIPKSGTIKVDNEIWFDSNKNINLPPQKRSIGFVFQDYALFPNMSVRENLLYANKNRDIDGLLCMMELENLANKKPHMLSGGQQQRVALARALMREPKILLLDEPLSALDHTMRKKLQDELTIIHEKLHITTLLVSHDIGETVKLSDMVAIIEDGKIIAIDKPINVFNNKNKNVIEAEIIDIEENGNIYKFTLLAGTSIVFVELEKDEAILHKIGQRIMINIEKIENIF